LDLDVEVALHDYLSGLTLRQLAAPIDAGDLNGTAPPRQAEGLLT
jgi:hypothetical protein